MTSNNYAEAAQLFRHALSPEDAARLPFYGQLVKAMAEDTTCLDILSSTPRRQRKPVLLLAALHYAARRDMNSMSQLFARGLRPGEDLGLVIDEVLREVARSPELITQHIHRSTQTNEPGRSAVIGAVLQELATRGSNSIALIDVGCSAGLNLYPDFIPVNDDASPLSLICNDLIDIDRTKAFPRIELRFGIDTNPLDVSREDDRQWLAACVWPEDQTRLLRLEQLVDTLPSWPEPHIFVGDATEQLSAVLLEIPDGVTPVIVNSWVLAYFSPAEQLAYYELVTELCRSAGAAWISIESSFDVAFHQLNNPAHPSPKKGASSILVCEPGGVPSAWGWCHPHGHWLSFTPSA